MEELLPIVGRLVEKYTGFESTSVTYEKAEQLMEAVLYCIHEAEQSGQEALMTAQRLSAGQAYETGAAMVEQKVKEAVAMYNELLAEFHSYGCRNLYDTVVKGLPGFFQWYDIKFEPQNTIVTLDYPVMKDLSGYSGIDRIYEFIRCIRMEQEFMNRYDSDYVKSVLRKSHSRYEDMMDNICEIFFAAVIVHILAGRPFTEQKFSADDGRRIEEWLSQTEIQEMEKTLKNAVSFLVQEYYNGYDGLEAYLSGAVRDTIVRLKNASDHNILMKFL